MKIITNPLTYDELQSINTSEDFAADFLKVDQTTPQTIINGAPIFSGGGISMLPSYGPEKVTDGSFSVAGLPNWVLGAGWADGTGNAAKNADGVGTLKQNLTGMSSPRIYKLVYTISSISGGSITATLTTGAGGLGTARSTAATFTEYLYCGSATPSLTFTPSATGVRAVIDNVSLMLESLQKVEWTAGGATWKMEMGPAWPTQLYLTRNNAGVTVNMGGIDGVANFYQTSGGGYAHYSAAEYTRTGVYWTKILSNASNISKIWTEKIGVNTTTPGKDIEINNSAGGSLRFTYNDFDGSAATYADMQIDSGGDLTITNIAGKTVVLAIPVYKDINIDGYLLAKPTSSAPGVDTFRSTGGTDTTIETLAFAVDEKVHGGFELQHDYKEGTDIVFHVHWQGIAAPTGTDNVQWRLNYIVCRDGVTLAAATEFDSPDTAIDTQYRCYRTDFAAITGTTFKIGDQVIFTLSRVASTGDAYAGDALIQTVGIHYQIDTIGSRSISAK